MKVSYTSIKVDMLSRYIRNQVFRFFVKYVFFNLFFMKFEKVLEAKIAFGYLNPNPNEKICDIACGCGEYDKKLLARGSNVVGVDIDPRSIKVAKNLVRDGEFIISNAEKLPFKSNTFDKVISVCALEHFEDDRLAICEMYRILKPNGYLVLTVDSFTYKNIRKDVLNAHRGKNFVVNYYKLSELKDILEKYGFEIKNKKYFVNSFLSVLFFNLSIKNVWISIIIFPIALTISIISDSLIGKNGGILLAVNAKKVSESESFCNLHS